MQLSSGGSRHIFSHAKDEKYGGGTRIATCRSVTAVPT